jgi:hypothetical protein
MTKNASGRGPNTNGHTNQRDQLDILDRIQMNTNRNFLYLKWVRPLEMLLRTCAQNPPVYQALVWADT